eukprot:scaffold2069_cov254-Pinguiococcus_pyrenoidosus.AAC.15
MQASERAYVPSGVSKHVSCSPESISDLRVLPCFSRPAAQVHSLWEARSVLYATKHLHERCATNLHLPGAIEPVGVRPTQHGQQRHPEAQTLHRYLLAGRGRRQKLRRRWRGAKSR